MSSVGEQSFSTSATSSAARRSEKQTSHSRDAGKFAHECGHFPGQIESSTVNFHVPRCRSCRRPDVQMERGLHFHFPLGSVADLNNFMWSAPDVDAECHLGPFRCHLNVLKFHHLSTFLTAALPEMVAPAQVLLPPAAQDAL